MEIHFITKIKTSNYILLHLHVSTDLMSLFNRVNAVVMSSSATKLFDGSKTENTEHGSDIPECCRQ